MRARVIVLAVLAAAGASLVSFGQVAGAQRASEGSGGAILGADQEATGSLLGDGSGAEVATSYSETVDPGSAARTGGSDAGGGGGNVAAAASPRVTCSLWALDATQNPMGAAIPSTESLQALWDRRAPGVTALDVLRVCYDAAGMVVSTEPTTWAPGATEEQPPLVDPAVLADAARSRLGFPAPVPRSSPGLDTGTYAQFPTTFWVDGWAPSSASATAGPVTATVTATPVSHEWAIRDQVRGETAVVTCDGPGAPAGGGEAGGCVWTPTHSSAGQPARGGAAAEPCFPATVTVQWDVSWTANVPGAGGALGAGTSSADTCLVVAEVQAVVSGTE